MFMMNQKMPKSINLAAPLQPSCGRVHRYTGVALSLLVVLGLSACSSNKSQAPIEMRTPQQAISGAKADPQRRTEVPATGVATGPSASMQKPPASAGAETGAVKQGNVESRPLGPAPAVSSGSVSAAGPVAGAPPLKSGPKGGKRPYSESVLAEIKGADAAQTAAGPGPGASAAAPATASSQAPASSAAAATPSSGSFSWPSRGKVSSSYSEPKHMGLSFDGQLGDPVLAAGDGKVIHSAVGPRGFGNLIIVKHDGELLTVYANNKALLVKEGQSVKKGQKIAELGDSGTDRPKLYFEIRRQGKPVDPKQFLPSR